MLPVVQSKDLSISEYEPSLDLFSKQKFYQQLPSTSHSGASTTFDIRSPSPNALLNSAVVLRMPVTFTYANVLVAGNDENKLAACVGGLLNCMRTCTLTINGATLSIPVQDIRRAVDILFANEDDRCYQSQFWGDGFDKTSRAGVNPLLQAAANVVGDSARKNRTAFMSAKAGSFNTACATNAAAFTVELECPIPIAPFKSYYKAPAWAWVNKQTEMLPHFNVAQLTIDWADSGNTVFNRANLVDVDVPHSTHPVSLFQANLNAAGAQPYLDLVWVSPPPGMVIPREVSLQTWHPQVYRKQCVAMANTVVNIAPAAGQANRSDYIRIEQVPSLMIICCQLNPASAIAPSNIAHQGRTGQFMFEMTALDLTVNTEASALNVNITSRQLYELTKENAPKNWSIKYDQWKNDGYCIAALRPNQLPAFSASPGTAFPSNITVRASFRIPRDGLAVANVAAADATFKVICFYDRHFLTLTRSSAKFSYQAISDRAAAVTLQSATRVGSGVAEQYVQRV